MNREETKKCIATMQAFVDGEDAVSHGGQVGMVTCSPRWDWCDRTSSYEAAPFEPKRGEQVMVSRTYLGGGRNDWYIRKFVVYHNGLYYCENSDDSTNLVEWDSCMCMPIA